eukprot:2022094-Amphidinium_carterae.1
MHLVTGNAAISVSRALALTRTCTPTSEVASPSASGYLDAMASSSTTRKQVGGSAADKKRRLSNRDKEHGVDLLIDGTEEGDKQYIDKVLSQKPHLLAHLASMLRDGSLEQGLQRKAAAKAQEFAPSSYMMKHVGVKFLREALSAMCPKVFTEESMTTWNLNMTDCLNLVTFATGQTGDSFLPHKQMQESKRLLVARYQKLGCRLDTADFRSGWSTTGYFQQGHRETNELNLLYCAFGSTTDYVTLPVSNEEMQKYTDWKLEENWSRNRSKL